MKISHSKKLLSALLAGLTWLPSSSPASEIQAGESSTGDFGHSTSLSENIVLIGAPTQSLIYGFQGAAYLYRNVDTAEGPLLRSARLVASNARAGGGLGSAVSISGNIGLVSSNGQTKGVYLFRDLDTASKTITENAILSLDGDDPRAVSISGNLGLVGARGESGAVYLYRDLDTITGSPSENLKIFSTDPLASAEFGFAVSLSGGIAVVGDPDRDHVKGAIYIYRGLDNPTLTAATPFFVRNGSKKGDSFGQAVSQSGLLSLVGAPTQTISNAKDGSAYVIRLSNDLSQTNPETVQLLASDSSKNGQLGSSVGISGNNAVVGSNKIGKANSTAENQLGGIYVFQNLDTAQGVLAESVKITRVNGFVGDEIGASVALDGDQFVFSVNYSSSFQFSLTGSVSSVTTLDAGNTSREINEINFRTRQNWIIGNSTNFNVVTLDEGSLADASGDGVSVFIGRSTGLTGNKLIINGTLRATRIYIGAVEGNSDNQLQLNEGGVIEAPWLRLAAGNQLVITGDYTSFSALSNLLGQTALEIRNGAIWEKVTSLNFANFITATYADGATTLLSSAVATLSQPEITSAKKINGYKGKPFSYQIQAQDGPTSFAAKKLPKGLTVNASGMIAGTPSKTGSFNATISAANALGISSQKLKIVVKAK